MYIKQKREKEYNTTSISGSFVKASQKDPISANAAERTIFT